MNTPNDSIKPACTCSPRWLTKGRGCRADCPALAPQCAAPAGVESGAPPRMYRVKVRRAVVYTAEVEVETTSPVHARRLALDLAEDRGFWADPETKATRDESVEELAPEEVGP
jgi:hypothetical protein